MAAAFQLSTARDAASWDAFVKSRPDATGYHEWAWRTVIERAFGHECHYLVAEAGGAIAGVLPIVEIRSLLFGRSMTSLPFLNYGGVLAASGDAARALAGEAARLATSRGCKHVEFRHIGRHFDDLPCKQHKVTMRLRLEASASAKATADKTARQGSESEDSPLWSKIDRKARNQVRKAQKSDLTVERGGSEFLDAFYRVFARNMRDLGTPVMPRRFFEEVTRAFGDRIRIIVVRLKDQPIAAGLTYRTDGLIEIPWASSVRDFNSLCPNHLLYWHALETAIAEGVEVFDFGRSTPGEGTYKFKEQWGAEPVPLHWEYWLAKGGDVPDQSPKNPKFHLAIEAWKRMPLWAANAVGPRLVRGIP